MSKPYFVSDGHLTLSLQPAGDGWYAVTSPLDPQLITQARSIEEAFAMAHDAQKSLADARKKLARQLNELVTSSVEPAPKKGKTKDRLAGQVAKRSTVSGGRRSKSVPGGA